MTQIGWRDWRNMVVVCFLKVLMLSLPDKVKLGYISYPVRAYVPKTQRCYRCQAYGQCEGGRGQGVRNVQKGMRQRNA